MNEIMRILRQNHVCGLKLTADAIGSYLLDCSDSTLVSDIHNGDKGRAVGHNSVIFEAMISTF